MKKLNYTSASCREITTSITGSSEKPICQMFSPWKPCHTLIFNIAKVPVYEQILFKSSKSQVMKSMLLRSGYSPCGRILCFKIIKYIFRSILKVILLE